MAIWAAQMHVFRLVLALAGRNGAPVGCNRRLNWGRTRWRKLAGCGFAGAEIIRHAENHVSF